MKNSEFNEQFRDRTKAFAITILKFYGKLRKNDEIRTVGKQLLRSSTSVAANFRAASRARSTKEFYAKICTVVEEADETQMWLELFEESQLVNAELTKPLLTEIGEILAIVTSMKTKTQQKLH